MLNRLLTRLAFELVDYLGRSERRIECPATRRRMSMIGASWAEIIRNPLITESLSANGNCIVSGPFKGLTMPEARTWGDGDLFAKLFGQYEQEVLTLLQSFTGTHFDAAVNIGCADGYYAIGLTRLLNPPITYAVDIDPAALNSCERLADSNGCRDRVQTMRSLDASELIGLATKHPSMLIVSDCEGYEVELFSDAAIRALKSSYIVIECHDRMVPECTKTLRTRFEKSHRVMTIEEGMRNPNTIPLLRQLPSLDRWAAISEGRGQAMTWLFAQPHVDHTIS